MSHKYIQYNVTQLCGFLWKTVGQTTIFQIIPSRYLDVVNSNIQNIHSSVYIDGVLLESDKPHLEF